MAQRRGFRPIANFLPPLPPYDLDQEEAQVSETPRLDCCVPYYSGARYYHQARCPLSPNQRLEDADLAGMLAPFRREPRRLDPIAYSPEEEAAFRAKLAAPTWDEVYEHDDDSTGPWR